MSKKVISYLLLVALCLSLLVGCGNKTETAGGQVTINWYMRKPVGDMSQQEAVEKAVNEITIKKIGLSVSFHFIENAAWSNKLNVMTSSGASYDILSLQGSEFINAAMKNAFADLSDSIDKYGKNIKEKSMGFAWDAVNIKGKILGIPSQTFYVPYTSYAFKKDLVEKYKFDYKNANTLESLEPFLKSIKENEPDKIGMVATSKGGLALPKTEKYSMTNLDFVYYNNETDEFEVKYFTDEVMDDYRTISEYYKKGYIASDAISKTETTSEIKSGRYAVVSGRRDPEKSTNLYGFDCVESEPTYGVISTTNVINAVNVVSNQSKNVDRAVQLLNLIWSDSYLSNIMAYGIENKDFTVVKGDIHNYKDLDEISIDTNTGNDVKWSIWHNWIGPLWDQWDSPWNSRASLNEMEKINSEAKVSPILGFMIDTNSIRTEVAQLTTITADADQVLRTGSMPDYDKYMDELKGKFDKAGIKTVLEEIEKQYNTWKK